MGFHCCRLFAVAICLSGPAIFSNIALAAQSKEARVTRVVKDVQLLASDASTRPASVNDSVPEGMKVRTGAESRTELIFSDQTVTRLGANTVFDFRDGSRNLVLGEGALLLQVPESARGAKINSGGMAAAVTGTTIVFESHPTHYKLLVLEGTGRLYRPGHFGDSVLLRAGQMVFGKPNTALSNPVDFDIGRFLKTCRFITDFPPLRSAPLMANEVEKQQRQKSEKTLIDTNLVIFGGGTLVSLVDPARTDAIDRTMSAPATMPSTAPPSAPTSTPTPAATSQ